MSVSDFANKLPSVNAWIIALIGEHRLIARPVASFGFTFAKDTLDRARVVTVDSVPKPPLSELGLVEFAAFEALESDGITYRDCYLLNRACVHDESLHFHELVHTIQWHLLGADRFLLAYASGYMSSGGYRNNPFERIAYHLQALFVDFPAPFQVEPLVRQHLSEIGLGFGDG
jgi:hypothetical protein